MSYITQKGHMLLNPGEKCKKYSIEMRHKRAITNDGRRKIDEKTGMTKLLTKDQLAYRAGYLAHQKDSNRAFRAKHPRYKRKTA